LVPTPIRRPPRYDNGSVDGSVDGFADGSVQFFSFFRDFFCQNLLPGPDLFTSFEGRRNIKCWSMLGPFCLFYVHLIHFVVIRYIFLSFGILYPFWYVVRRKSDNTGTDSVFCSPNKLKVANAFQGFLILPCNLPTQIFVIQHEF
jgi:hypothetical protein